MAQKKPTLDLDTGLLNYGWLRDPDIKAPSKIGGKPPAGHVRQCQGTNRFRVQCPKWALRGRDFCKRHGTAKTPFRRNTLWYARVQTEGLKERLAKMSMASPDERMALNVEIDLARELADHALETFEKCHYGPKADEIKKEKPHLRIASRDALKDALSHVTDLVAKATKVHVMSNAVMEMQHVEYVAAQFTAIIEKFVLPLDKKTADSCLAHLAHIKIPSKADNVADQLREAVKEMDDTLNC